MILCANNEYATPELDVSGRSPRRAISPPAHVEALYAAVGVSIVELERDGTAGAR